MKKPFNIDVYMLENKLDLIKNNKEYQLSLLIKEIIDQKVRELDSDCSCTHNECACM